MEKNLNAKSVKDTIDIHFLLNQLKLQKTLSQIASSLNISKQALSYHIKKLKREGIIEKLGYGTWKVKIQDMNTLTNKGREIRGHAFIWQVKLNKSFDWLKILNKNNIEFRLIRGLFPRIFIKNKKVWLNKDKLTIYEPDSFMGINSLEARKYAVVGLNELIIDFKRVMNINFDYFFKPCREHYGMIKNELARQYNRKNEKMVIRDTEGEWLWIDDSETLGELETNKLIVSKQMQDWWNNQKGTQFKVTPDFILNCFAQTQSQLAETRTQLLEYRKQNQEHLKLIKQWQKDNVGWRKNETIKISKDIKAQKELTKWL